MKQELANEIEQMKMALQEAIADAEESAEETTYGGFDGQLLSKSGGKYTYQMTLRTYWDIDEHAKIVVVDAASEQQRTIRVEARVLSHEANKLLIVTRAPLPPEHLPHVLLKEDKSWLLKRQLQALTNLQEISAEFGAKALGLLPVRSGTKAVRGKLGKFVPHPHQERAIAHGLGSEKTLIIGPPGTGKTTTLSNLICRYLRQGLSVLLVSHTNIATDNAFLRLVDAMRESKKADLQTLLDAGLVVRAGDPRHASLRTGNYRSLTVDALAEARMGSQIEARERLEQALPELSQRIEDATGAAQKQEAAWRERRAECEQKMATLEQDRATVQARIQERERKEQEFLTAKAKERQAAQEILAPLQRQQEELREARASWVTEAEQEVKRVRAMGRVARFFSAYRDYDFEAAEHQVTSLFKEKEQAEAMDARIEQLLTENASAQMTPNATVRQIERDIQGFFHAKKLVEKADQQEIEQKLRQLASLRQEREHGEQQVEAAYAQVSRATEERDRITARIEELKAQQENLKGQIIADAQMVAATVTSVYVNAHLLLREFEVVVIDEVSMISVIGTLLAASRATAHLVGAGDPMQLEPVVKLTHEGKAPLAKAWLGKDLFTYQEISIFDAIRGEKECCLLTEQGRSYPSIIAPINHYVYQEMLTSREETTQAPEIEPHPQWPLLLVDTTGTEARCLKPSRSQPRENEYHACLAVALAQQALASLPPRPQSDDPTIPRIAIIAPYRSQVQLTQKKLREAKIAHLVHVGTINTVQSLEFPVVIFDTVEAPGIRPWAFTFDAVLNERQMATGATRKLTVAWTRARHKLIVIAHRKHLRDHLPWPHVQDDPAKKQRLLYDLVEWAAREGQMSADELLTPSLLRGKS
jgi:ABC-type cobalamin/Fe3+-siderophores transport system ATPase subunit